MLGYIFDPCSPFSIQGFLSKSHQLYSLLDGASLELQRLWFWSERQLQHALWSWAPLSKLDPHVEKVHGWPWKDYLTPVISRDFTGLVSVFWTTGWLNHQMIGLTSHSRPQPGRGECVSTMSVAGLPCCISETIQIETPVMTICGVSCNVGILFLNLSSTQALLFYLCSRWPRTPPCALKSHVVVIDDGDAFVV